MSYWVELHCDGAEETDAAHAAARAAGIVILSNLCPSKRGDQPGEMVHQKSNLAKVVREMEQTARRRGWKKISGEWFCKACAPFVKKNA